MKRNRLQGGKYKNCTLLVPSSGLLFLYALIRSRLFRTVSAEEKVGAGKRG